MPMSTIQEHTHPDAKLVIDAIIELNISRHKAGIYPEGHPEIDASLGRAYETFLKLFEVRGQITLAAAKDTLYVDECLLDKNHPVYREVALCLSSKSISSITFARGLSKEELHTFNRFLSRDTGDLSPDDLEEEFHQHGLSYIKAEFIDYEAFSFAEERPDDDNLKRGLWARYVQELIRGNLRSKKYAVIREIPPDIFARLINAVDKTDLTDDASDRVMTTYLWQSLEKVSLITDLNKLIKFINRLRPGLGQRGEILKSLGRKLREHRDELLALSTANNGATASDGSFDVDGAGGMLAFYGALGQSLGERRLLVDGDGVQLGKSEAFWTRHAQVPRRGVALHVNAFNFPAWGFAEKFACAFLAGVPVITKPATATALVAHRMVEGRARVGPAAGGRAADGGRLDRRPGRPAGRPGRLRLVLPQRVRAGTLAPDGRNPTEDNGISVPRADLHIALVAADRKTADLLKRRVRVVKPPLWNGKVYLHVLVEKPGWGKDDYVIRQAVVDLGWADSRDLEIGPPDGLDDGYPSGDES